ncbi:MAG: efflux RND transporter periplasmic adaptor subunit [Candidatus Daviesbacteria bacterium]|nr:efflux RND transporter periplasmic adaptor subunit [Candidatus Daviesbacteria bacterium]
MKKIISFFRSHPKIIIFLFIILVGGFIASKTLLKVQQTPQYQTAVAEKGTLINSISASGQITNANNVQVTIQASGVVKKVYVKNGDQVYTGQNMATLTLDQASEQKATSAWANYLSAKNSLDSANTKYYTLQAAAFKANQAFINGSIARGLDINNPTYIQENDAWLQTEADYKNQANAIAQAQASLASASLTLNQVSSTITAPVSGVVKGLTITPGAIVTLSTSSTSSTSQVLGSIYQTGPIQAAVNISEVDSVNVSEGQKVTMTLDAFPNLTFSGKVVSINTNGVVASGVTVYPAVISFDSGNDHIYPNMGVNASIITNIKNDVITVPNAAVQTTNGQSTVKVINNNNITSVPVTLGLSNTTDTEIVSGINEGDNVVTNVITAPATNSGASSSPFGGATRGGFGGGGGAIRAVNGGR